MVAAPWVVLVSSAAVLHCRAKAMFWLPQTPPLTWHWSCHSPWSWLFTSTVQAKVSPVNGFTASVPRKMGQPVEPGTPGFVGQNKVLRPVPGCAASRVQVMPSVDL